MRDILRWVVYGSVFAVPFVLLIVSGSMFFPYITGKNFAFRILVEVAFAAYILLALLDSTYRPRWSYIIPAIGGMVTVMLLAGLLGEYAPKSLWSNYERMEGWITLVHFFMYFLVLSSVLYSEKLWNWFFNTALVAAVIMSLYALGQSAGMLEISQGNNWRVDGRLGNSSYLGVYMLFQMFIAAWMFLRTKSQNLKFLYGGLFFLFGYLLFHTGTRGTALGLVGGSILTFGYLALMAEKGANIKKWALGGLLCVVLIAGGLWAARDTSFVQDNEMLKRVVGVTLSEGNIRFTIWRMALEGFKERPILGWGQENFNYVFNKYYEPSLYNAEAWYDRTHNIFMDWLIAGGVLGLLSYLTILLTALWYVIPRFWSWLARLTSWFIGGSKLPAREINQHLTVQEQALLLGLLAAYMFHNLFVFDNLASWIFYAVVLALIHYRVTRDSDPISSYRVDRVVLQKVIAPLGVLIAGVAIYFINVPGILAARDIINAYRQPPTSAQQQTLQLEALMSAQNRGSFADQEIAEQLAQLGGQAIASGRASGEQQAKIVSLVEETFNDLIDKKPGDARSHVILGSFYRMAGELDKSLEQLLLAQELSPRKQDIIDDIALIYLAGGQNEKAIEFYERAYELDKRNQSALVHLAVAHLVAGDEAKFNELIPKAELDKKGDLWFVYVNDLLTVQALNQIKRYDLLEFIFEARVANNPSDPELRINLAAAYFEGGNKEMAIAVLEQAIEDIPSFRDRGRAMIRQLRGE